MNIEQIIKNLQEIAASRGMGAQMETDIEGFTICDGGMRVEAITGKSQVETDAKERVEELLDEVDELKRDKEKLEDQLADVREKLSEMRRVVGA